MASKKAVGQLLNSPVSITETAKHFAFGETEDVVEVNYCPEEEGIEIEKVFDKQVNEKLKSKTLAQLKCAKDSAGNVSKYVGECIQELEEKVIFEEPLEQQYFRIFGIKYPSSRLSLEQYYKVVAPVLKIMTRDNQQFFYEHYKKILPPEIIKNPKYYF